MKTRFLPSFLVLAALFCASWSTVWSTTTVVGEPTLQPIVLEEDSEPKSNEPQTPTFGPEATNSFIADFVTPEIQALADGLERDPKRIYDFVHDQIRYVHYFGCKKGALLTLLERSGNAFDQSALLVALLRAAGETNVSYEFGTVVLPYQTNTHRDFLHWVGLTKEHTNANWSEVVYFVYMLNFVRGYPYTDTNLVGQVAFHHVWVRLVNTNGSFQLDPAIKVNEPVQGTNFAAMISLETNALMTAAQGYETTNYVTNLNASALFAKLGEYSTNLSANLKAFQPSPRIQDVLGGHRIVSSVGDPLDYPVPYTLRTGTTNSTWTNWLSIPTNFMSRFSINIPTSPVTNRSFWMPDLRGRRLSLVFDGSSVCRLWLDDELQLQVTIPSSSSPIYITTEVNHPFAAENSWDFSTQTFLNTSWLDQVTPTAYQRANASYALLYSFDVDEARLKHRQSVMGAYRQRGLSDASREVTTETLNVMGVTYMLQTELIGRTLFMLGNTVYGYHHRVGRMAQEIGKGYYVDFYQQLRSAMSADGRADPEQQRAFDVADTGMYFGSAGEHALIEQLQSTNLVGASTVKMLAIANARGDKIFLADKNNWKTGIAVKSQLVGYGNLDSLDQYLTNSGYSALIPRDGAMFVTGTSGWRGYGFMFQLRGQLASQVNAIISGGYFGGYSSMPWATVNPTYIANWSALQPTIFSVQPPSVPRLTGADPVNMADGSFESDAVDLALGGTAPRGLAFSRSYSSSRRQHNPAGLAHGWTHNYHFKCEPISAPFPVLGMGTAEQMAPMLVATKAAYEIMRGPDTPKHWLVAALIAKWGMDQTISNAVSVVMGKDTVQFVKQPDGKFSPPPASTMTLTNTGSGYVPAERHGNKYSFATNGRLSTMSDPYGKALTFAYTNPPGATGLVQSVKDWTNRGLFFTYNSGTPSRLAKVTDSTGRSVGYAYGASGDLIYVTNAEQKVETFVYDTNHQVLATRDALGRVTTTNIYDALGQVIEQRSEGSTNKTWRFYWSGVCNIEKDPTDGKRWFWYDDQHRPVAQADALGNLTENYYDGQDHLVMRVSPTGATNRFEYDARHNLLRWVDPLDHTNNLFYDAQDRLVRTVDSRGATNWFGYNDQHRLTATTNAAGDWTTFTYSASDGNLLSQSDAGGTTTYGYDGWGQLNSVLFAGGLGSEGFSNNAYGDVLIHTNARGFLTTNWYNNLRQLTKTAASNAVTELTYDPAGNLYTSKDPRLNVTTHSNSATQKLLSTTLPATAAGTPVLRYQYDPHDWLEAIEDPLQHTNWTAYDLAGRVIAKTDPLLRTTWFGLDAAGALRAQTNALLQATFFTNDARGLRTAITDAAGRTTYHGYDSEGNRTTLTNRRTRSFSFLYDPAGRLATNRTPEQKETRRAYDNRGLLATVTEPSGDTTVLIYDARGHLTVQADVERTNQFVYDPNGNLLRLSENTQTNAWGYDTLDRVTGFTNADAFDLQYRYDQSGNLTNLVYPEGRNVFYAYDSHNRLTNILDWRNNRTSFQFDLAGRMTNLARANGTRRAMTYDAADQMTNIVERQAGGGLIASWALRRDALGRITNEFMVPVPHRYTEPSRQVTYDGDNRIATWNGASVTHDDDGNMTTGPLTDAAPATYTYDARNRLLQTVNAQLTTLSYAYDPSGSRTAVTNGTNVTRFVMDASGFQVLMRMANGVTNYYVYGAGLLYEVRETANSTNTLVYHYDLRGSTVALTDGTGAVRDRLEYSPYGAVVWRVGTNDTPFQFNGRYGVQTDANGLLHMRARYYNPYLCRFVNADPAGFEGGMNWYAYADGDPVNKLDPFGLAALSSGHSWLDATFAGTWLGDWLQGFGRGLESWAAGEDLDRYVYSGSDAYLSGIQSGYRAVPSLIEVASVILTAGGGGGGGGGRAVAGSTLRAETRMAARGTPAFDSLLRQVRAADFSTPRNGAVFWTGHRQGNQAAAMSWAAANDKFTIEMTRGGQWLNGLNLYGPNSPVTAAEANVLWNTASERFASGASGSVNAFTRGTTLNPNSAFYNIELPILRGRRITYRGY